jgi:hypothetical protein
MPNCSATMRSGQAGLGTQVAEHDAAGCERKWSGDGSVDLAGDVALEAAGDLAGGEPFGGAARDVGDGALIAGASGHHDGPQRMVGGAVAATVETMTVGLARRRADRCDPAQVGERRLGVETLGVVAGGDQQPGSGVDADPDQIA